MPCSTLFLPEEQNLRCACTKPVCTIRKKCWFAPGIIGGDCSRAHRPACPGASCLLRAVVKGICQPGGLILLLWAPSTVGFWLGKAFFLLFPQLVLMVKLVRLNTLWLWLIRHMSFNELMSPLHCISHIFFLWFTYAFWWINWYNT